MSEDLLFERVVWNPEGVTHAFRVAFDLAQNRIAAGERVRITVGPAFEPIGIQQRRFLHGVVLRQISEQVKVGGERFVVSSWKEFYRRKFVGKDGWEWKMVRLPGSKKATPIKSRASTEDLGERAYAKFIDDVIQDATVELGVQFVFTSEEQTLLTHKPRKAPA